MVNILNFWPKDEVVPEVPSQAVMLSLLSMRAEVAEGFAKLENSHGLRPDHPSLAMPATQDYLRLIGFRFLEEVAESLDSRDEDHRLEELIDAINYLLIMAMIDPDYISQGEIALSMAANHRFGNLPQLEDNITELVKVICGELADTLRNRSWMNQAQDIVWAGKHVFMEAFRVAWGLITSEFPDWPTFYKYYFAKNEVLLFRLRTNY